MRRLGIYIFFLAFSFGAQAAPTADDFAYSAQWLKLLHYHGSNGSFHGLIDSAEFYVSPDGRNNPKAELQAEIKAFSTADNTQKCEFPARFEWLKKQGLISGDLKNCKEYQQFMNDVQPNGVTLLFTDAYMNNPASMFGHTLVRIDTARKGTQMLAHGSNFGVTSGADSGLAFILKGLFGGYDGKYFLNPYWTVINTYNNIENRDIWEYSLNLSKEEQLMFVNHLYEMQNKRIQYFFLTKNCSYMLLELIEAVRPELDLTSGYNVWAIPLDTIKTVKSEPNLVGNVHYRPARYTKIMAQIKNMSKPQYEAFLTAIKEHNYEMPQLTEQEQATVLETAYQYYQYIYIAKEMELKEYRKNSFAVLRKRSAMPPVAEHEIAGEDPSLAHDSAQIALSAGINRHQSYEQITIRPAYTDLMNNNFGLIKGAGVKVLESSWRYYNQRHKLVLQNFTGLNIRSLVPSNRVFTPYSYTTDMSLRREYSPQTLDEGYVANIGFGLGRTYALSDSLRMFGLLQAGGQYGGFLPHNQWVGLTPEIGIFSNFERFRLFAAASYRFTPYKSSDRLMYRTAIAFDLTRNLGLELSYESDFNARGRNREQFATSVRYAF